MKLDQLIQGLTTDQIRELGARGVSAARVSDWKHGRRSPTTAQAKVLAIVTGEPFGPMAEEIAMREATPAQREFFRTMTAACIAILSAVLLLTLPSESQAWARVYSASAAQAHAVSQPTNLYIVVFLGWQAGGRLL